jgi:putative DNA-invertase from lambdoid prophage Rac
LAPFGWAFTLAFPRTTQPSGTGPSLAQRREIDVVLVWRLDRWGRSVADLVSSLQELQHLRAAFVSLTEALDLTTPAGRAMAGLLAVFAEF